MRDVLAALGLGLLSLLSLVLGGCSPPADRAAVRAPSPLKDASLLVERGKAYAAVGDFTRAQQYFAAAISAGGSSSAIVPHLLRTCVESGDLRLASEYAEVELARHPDDARLRFLTGALFASTGNRPVARKHLVLAATELPQDADVQFAVAAFFRDDLDDKIGGDPYFREYLKLAPRGPHAEEAKASLMEVVQ